ncbi:DoxX family protein [Nonomuraea africana]|uniref:Oxidoreductase n=1 Tax=Nonomuraea africana TaxID=46171 RepID=A0ABR9KPU9_9ACTN|nr:DoxX family protein [Nonomuraea africana]MBE1564047.1 putative oxidoreductase [Nonomuraea africana]
MKVTAEDIGVLMLRVPAGLLLMGHGAQKLFGWFGGGGPDKTGEVMTALGYPHGKLMGLAAGLGELGSGAGIALGAATPLSSAGLIATMTNAAVSAHLPQGLWAQHGGFEYPLVLGAGAASLAVHGPGKLSVDAVLGCERKGLAWGVAALALGLGAAAAVLTLRRQHTGEPSEAEAEEPVVNPT